MNFAYAFAADGWNSRQSSLSFSRLNCSKEFLMPETPFIFAFDLDGTVTTREILPVLAQELGLAEEMGLLTRLTLNGTLDFESSFRLRFAVLRSIPLTRVREIVAEIPLDPHITEFIRARRESCAIVTGNLDCWVEPLLKKLGCLAYVSESCNGGGLLNLQKVLNKGDAVRELARSGKKIVAIGESANDLPMFEAADLRVAFAGVHKPVAEILRIADHVARDGKELSGLLEGLRA